MHPSRDDVTAILASVGAQLRDARQHHGWYLTDVAERVAVSPSVICRLELARREPSLLQVLQVSAALSLRPSGVVARAEASAGEAWGG